MNNKTEELQMALAEAYLGAQMIADIAFDYDGYREAKSLIGLIDELRDRAIDLAKFCAEQVPNDVLKKFMAERMSKCCLGGLK